MTDTGERQPHHKHLTKDLNALPGFGEQWVSRGSLYRQNVLKDFPRQRARDTTKSSTLGHATCARLQGGLCTGDVPKGYPSSSTQPSNPEAKRGPSWAINLQPAFYIPNLSSTLCFQCILFSSSMRHCIILGNLVAFLSFPSVQSSVLSKSIPRW